MPAGRCVGSATCRSCPSGGPTGGIGGRAGGQLADQAPGASPMHGLLADEVAEILALFDEWGETDRPHRKLAHRGSYLGRVWVFPSSVGRVLFLADKHFRPLPKPADHLE